MASAEAGTDLQLQIVPNDDGQLKVHLSSPDSNTGATPAAGAQDDLFVIDKDSPTGGSEVFLSPKEELGNDSKAFTLGDDSPTARPADDEPDAPGANPAEEPEAAAGPSQEAQQESAVDLAAPEQLQKEDEQPQPLQEEPLQEEPLRDEQRPQVEPLHDEPLPQEPAATAAVQAQQEEAALQEEPLQDPQPAQQPALAAPMLPPPSPFFPIPKAANGPSSSSTAQPQVTGRSVPTSQNGTAEFSPPSSPHPLDNIKPPTILQVDASYQGLLFSDGYDTHGRPVIVLNTSALPPKARKDEALTYLREQLSPIVNQGPYVLVLLACSTGPTYKSLPSLWTVSAYRSLARPFHKNVKFIIMVNPSLLVRCVLAIVKPFVKKKAYHKLKKVRTLEEIDLATNSEVRREHLGHAFLSYVQRQQQAGAQQQVAQDDEQ